MKITIHRLLMLTIKKFSLKIHGTLNISEGILLFSYMNIVLNVPFPY